MKTSYVYLLTFIFLCSCVGDLKVDLKPETKTTTTTTPVVQVPPTPRLISNSYNTTWNGPIYKLPASMSTSGFEINTTGVVDGDLLLIIASIDNGSDTMWPDPIAPGFTNLYQKFYGSDGQTFVAAWKIANNEPASYTGSYGPGGISYSTTISLIAVSGANQSAPINATNFSYGTAASDSNPAVGTSTGVTTTVNNCTIIHASGVDWNNGGTATFSQPASYTVLTQIGDQGTTSFDWVSQQVSYLKQPTLGATGVLTSSQTSTGAIGISWNVVIAIAPQ